MYRIRRAWSRKYRLWTLAAAAFAMILLLPASGVSRAVADGESTIIMIEEDWQLILNEPGTLNCAPQFHTVMSPHSDLSSEYGQILWNYRENDDYHPGGLQIEAWRGDTLHNALSFFEDPLSNTAETITWTQRMLTNGSHLYFEIARAHSTSWGDFGGWYMSVALYAPLPHLGYYTPTTSQQYSGVTYGSNRVNLLVINEVRKYSAAGLESRDTTPIIVYQAGGDGAGAGQ